MLSWGSYKHSRLDERIQLLLFLGPAMRLDQIYAAEYVVEGLEFRVPVMGILPSSLSTFLQVLEMPNTYELNKRELRHKGIWV